MSADPIGKREAFCGGDRFRILTSANPRLVGTDGELTGVQWAKEFVYVSLRIWNGTQVQFSRDQLERIGA